MGKYEVREWENIIRLSEELARKIKKKYRPDLVVALARGGWVPARILCDLLGVKDLLSLKIEHWGITARPDGKASIKYGFDTDLSGRKVLVLDDCVDTGESLKLAVQFLRKLGPAELKTASLQIFDSTPADAIPDFYVEKVPWVWLIYPWNAREDARNIASELKEKGLPEHEVFAELRKIGLPEEVLQDIKKSF